MSNVIKVQNLCYRNLHCEFYAFVRLPLINETIDFTEFELRKKSIVHSTKCGKNRSLLQYKIFRETNLHHDILVKTSISKHNDKENCVVSASSHVTVSHCENYGSSFSHIFGKNLVKATVLLNKLLNS